MKTTKVITGALVAAATVAVAAQANAASNRSYQAYAIVDFKTDAPKAMLADTVEKAIAGYASDLQTNRPIGVPMPETPGRCTNTRPRTANGTPNFRCTSTTSPSGAVRSWNAPAGPPLPRWSARPRSSPPRC